MNFIEAAIELLREAGEPLSVEALCERALSRDMLARPGKTPLRSMKARLTTELKKGDASRVTRVEDGVWTLANGTPQPPVEASPPPEGEAEIAAEPAPELSDEEQAIAEVYGDELSLAGPTAYAEYRDQQTEDEDRPLRPEIVPHRERRRDKREQMRERRKKRSEERAARKARRAAQAQQQPQKHVAQPGPAGDTVAAVASLLDGRDGKPMGARQLADMAKGRKLLDGDVNELTRTLQAVLLHDQQRRRARGLRPRVAHRGRDLFGSSTAGLSKELLAAEAAVEQALVQLEAATRQALRDRLARLALDGLETVSGLYLRHAGWTAVTWIKRVDRSAYAEARDGRSEEGWLVGARIGPQPVDRRGVGELRAGVIAKGLERGLLLSPCELSPEAEEELDADGPPISVLVGDAFVGALASVGIGVAPAAAPVLYLDNDFLGELGGK